MEFEQFCAASRVVIVAGKGGVGKTTVTAALGLAASRAGLSVLVIEIEGKSGLSAIFGQPPLTYDTSTLQPGLDARTLTPDRALVDYLNERGLKRLSKRLASSGALDIVSTAVPGIKDILVLGKVKQLERAEIADLIIVDAPAAGHAVSFLLSPQGLYDAVRVGPIRRQATEVIEFLTDPSRCRVVMVSIPEETPITELIETAFAIEDRAGVALGPVVINGCYPPSPIPSAEVAALVAGLGPVIGDDVNDGDVNALVAAASFLENRHSRQALQTNRLSVSLPLPQIHLPFKGTAELGSNDIAALADVLVEQIEQLA